ncbi:MAG: hypothetical protein ACYSQZ_05560 [Planctomycetota bacterium]
MVKGCDSRGIWDQTARDALAWTMAQAEEMIAEYLNFWPAPKFITDEEIAFRLPGVRGDWWNAEIETEWAYNECFGTEQLTLVQAGANVIYTDSDGDPNGREELATISGTGLYVEELAACDDKCEVAIFFREEDGAEDPADCRWEIRPIKVDIDGATMSITAESSLFVKPELWELTELNSQVEPGNAADNLAWIIEFDTSNLVQQVDIYCRTVNEATPLTLQWEGVCDCPGVCQHKTQTACAYRTDKRRGFFAPRAATWNGTTNVYTTPLHCNIPPESVLANYRAGYPLDKSCRMNASMERAIVKLTNALLPEPPCGFCGDVAVRTWQDDRRPIDPLTPEAAAMPWDIYKRGALEAWRIVKLFAMAKGGKVGRGYR